MKKLSRQVELMDLESANIRVAEYRAHIPDMKLLKSICSARLNWHANALRMVGIRETRGRKFMMPP